VAGSECVFIRSRIKAPIVLEKWMRSAFACTKTFLEGKVTRNLIQIARGILRASGDIK
jgi:hypothetical protein